MKGYSGGCGCALLYKTASDEGETRAVSQMKLRKRTIRTPEGRVSQV